MTQVNDLVAYARAQGEAFHAGKIATGNTFESARVQAILPAIKAIESKEVALTSDLPGTITRAYAEGARITYAAASEKTAVSKTAQFLIAADKGKASEALEYVERIIRETNDNDVQATMRKRAFEKLTDVCRLVNKTGALPSRVEVLTIINPPAVNATQDEQLAALFKKMAKLAENIAKLDIDRYGALATEAVRYERLSDEHEARAKRSATREPPSDATTAPGELVTPHSNQPVAEMDDVDQLLAA